VCDFLERFFPPFVDGGMSVDSLGFDEEPNPLILFFKLVHQLLLVDAGGGAVEESETTLVVSAGFVSLLDENDHHPPLMRRLDTVLHLGFVAFTLLLFCDICVNIYMCV
jgi:hypothetical protein